MYPLNMVPMENTTNLMYCNEIKGKRVARSWHKITHKKNTLMLKNLFGHVLKRDKLENLMTTGMMEGKSNRRKQIEKMLDVLT